jgi:hypothetical protein
MKSHFAGKSPASCKFGGVAKKTPPGEAVRGHFAEPYELNGALLAFQRNFGYPVGEVRRDA